MTKIAGSGSISQRHGSPDPDPDPDPQQNVMDPQHLGIYNLGLFLRIMNECVGVKTYMEKKLIPVSVVVLNSCYAETRD
jgi:hypothetical protein